MAVGLVGYIGIGVESSGNTAGTNAYSAQIVDFLPFVSETLQVTRQDLPDPSLGALWDERRMYGGQQNVAGNITAVCHPLLAGYLLHAAFDVETVTQGFLTPSAAGIREHRFTLKQTQFQAGSGSDLPTLTVEVYRGPLMTATAQGSSFYYYNCTANALELDIQAGQLIRMQADLVGRDYGGGTKSVPTFAPADGWTWNQASVAVAGQGTSLFSQLTIRVENNLQPIPKLDGRLRADLLKRQDFRRVMVNGALVFESFSEWDRFQAGSEARLTVFCQATSNTLFVDVPRMRYSTLPVNVSGPGPIQVQFTGRGMIDPVSGYALECWLVNTRISPYTQNVTA
jgi:hypothetical protein